MNGYVRAEIRLETMKDINLFFKALQMCDENDFALEDETGNQHIAAESMLGLLYACSEWKRLFIVNLTNDGYFPEVFDQFRPLN